MVWVSGLRGLLRRLVWGCSRRSAAVGCWLRKWGESASREGGPWLAGCSSAAGVFCCWHLCARCCLPVLCSLCVSGCCCVSRVWQLCRCSRFCACLCRCSSRGVDGGLL